MASNLRHGYGRSHKQPFQRKSQQASEPIPAGNSSVRLVWVAAIFLAAGLVLGYFVVHHFATEGVGTRSEADKALLLPLTETITTQAVVETKAVKASSDRTLNVVSVVSANVAAKVQQPLVYSFYHGLSETEVLVDAEPISIALESPYYIQAGTFGNPEQAEKERQRLRRLGQETDVTLYEGKRLYYRLRVGPFTDRLALNKRRNELMHLGVDTLLVKSAKPVVAGAVK